MVHLVVRLTPHTKEEREKLELMLNAWELKVIHNIVDERKSVLKLSINASMPSVMEHVIFMAQQRFQENLLESIASYEPES